MCGSITDVPGILIGQEQNNNALTGCTVILCKDGATAGVDQRGGAPGTRETDLLKPMHMVNKIHAVVLSGGSAFGLDTASGVMRYLEENDIGLDTGYARVPIVCGAVLYDLGIGSAHIRPDAQMGYQACQKAAAVPPEQGNFGAGTGATLGKILGMEHAMKSGIGSASIKLGNGLVIGAIIAVNPVGDILNPSSSEIIAGAWIENNGMRVFVDTMKVLEGFTSQSQQSETPETGNTIIGVVATNARLNKEEVNKVAQMSHNGLARVVSPAHTMIDGDTIFALSTGDIQSDINIVGSFAAKVVADAIFNAVTSASDIDGFPSYSSLSKGQG